MQNKQRQLRRTIERHGCRWIRRQTRVLTSHASRSPIARLPDFALDPNLPPRVLGRFVSRSRSTRTRPVVIRKGREAHVKRCIGFRTQYLMPVFDLCGVPRVDVERRTWTNQIDDDANRLVRLRSNISNTDADLRISSTDDG
jgi:hypothetical protein